MKIYIISLFIFFAPTLSLAEQNNILNYIPPIIAASYENNSFSVGTIRSTNTDHIDINHKFNSWLIIIIDSKQEIRLKVFEKKREYDVPALWALAIRTQSYPVGSISAKDLEIKLGSSD